MSDLERINLKALPPVPPLADWPDRYSQTLLKKADACLRSAWLYVKYHGGAPGHQLDRGSLSHAVFQRMTEDLLEADEESYVSPAFTQDRHGVLVEEDPEMAARQIASMTAEVVDEVARERTDLVVPFAEMEAVRVMAYHFALGWSINPATVAGVERKFILDVAGHEISGIVDFCTIDGQLGGVDDFKTSWNRLEQGDYEDGFQGRLYALLLAFGQPVEKVHCGDCSGKGYTVSAGPGDATDRLPCRACGGVWQTAAEPGRMGRGYVEVRLPPIGGHLQAIRTRELYPRFLERMPDGSVRLQQRENTLTRTNLSDFRRDLERMVAQLDEAQETGRFPAVAGGHCNECPASSECPLPAHLRDWQGAIDSPEQAAEAASWADTMGARVTKVNAEIKRWAGEHEGRVRYGADLVREFKASVTTSVRKSGGKSDWDGLRTAVKRAAELGEEFDEEYWIKQSSTNNFKKRTLSAEELAAETEEEKPVQSLDERFGAEVPF